MATSTPIKTDPKRQVWAKMLTQLQGRSNALAKNNLQPTDTLRQIKVKILNSLNGK
jgi:hypothetical protein